MSLVEQTIWQSFKSLIKSIIACRCKTNSEPTNGDIETDIEVKTTFICCSRDSHDITNKARTPSSTRKDDIPKPLPI